MNNRYWCAFLTLILLCCGTARAAERQNVVVLLVDDLGWTDLGCFGSDLYETPNIDRLAASGMRFTNAYAACTVCSPTRAALLTGQSPARLHVTDFIPGHPITNTPVTIPDWTQKLEHRHVTIAEILKEHGYRTAHVGKWHLTPRIRPADINSDGNFPEYYPETQGFDVNIGGHEGGAPRSYFWPYGRGKGETRKENNLFRTLPPGGEEGEYLTDRLTDEAVKFIEGAAGENQPFFLYFAYYTVHTPLQAKPDDVEYFRKKIEASAKTLRHRDPVYAAMVRSLDESVGRLMETLEASGIDDETLVVFTSDNGGLTDLTGNNYGTSNLPLRQGKGSIYEGGVRVPAIVRWPDVTESGSVSDEPVISMDWLPTILEAVDVAVPEAVRPVLDGRSLVPVLSGEEEALPERNLYWHYPHYHMMGAVPHSAVRSGEWKLIERHAGEPLELYNLAEDIHEDDNLAARRPAMTRRLKSDLDAWRTAVGAQMPAANSDHDPAEPIGWERNGRMRRPKPVRKD
ncbi:Arylsulfatase [Maioricimonas rarisocia]|uniref:Arylsulfatase n=1 Tax=Maioricimonas rarisocia TaxID=2528026 RepID=A0A517ZFB7_9PLAN|nr:sulfatase [Maioricimonas rarisocia]QDU41161.1 Arylsulfatase [Maioricimonas rarisocia]